MHTTFAIIANGGHAIDVIDREAVEINYFLLSLLILLKPLAVASANPFQRGSRGLGYAWPKTPCCWRGK